MQLRNKVRTVLATSQPLKAGASPAREPLLLVSKKDVRRFVVFADDEVGVPSIFSAELNPVVPLNALRKRTKTTTARTKPSSTASGSARRFSRRASKRTPRPPKRPRRRPVWTPRRPGRR